MKRKAPKKVATAAVAQSPLTEKQLRYLAVLLLALAVVAATVAIAVREALFVHLVDEQSLFLNTTHFFAQQLLVPAGMLSYCGAFFTQFFHLPWLGALLFSVLSALVAGLSARAMALPHRWAAVTLLPFVLLLLTGFTLGYAVYYIKLPGYFFAAPLGFGAALLPVWLFRVVGGPRWVRCVVLLLTVVAGYPLIGAYAFLSALLMCVLAWRMPSVSLGERIMLPLVAIVAVVFVPQVAYRTLYPHTASADLWRQGLPLFDFGEVVWQYYVPYCLLAVLLLLMAATSGERLTESLLRRRKLWLALQAAVIAVAVAGCCRFWYADKNFTTELAMQQKAEERDWEGVLRLMGENTTPPTRQMWMLKNMAAFYSGRGGDILYNYSNGDTMPNAPMTVKMVTTCGKMLYLNFGLPNYCYRWCMEDGVEYGWRATTLKYLARAALVNGETTLARKFIDLLKKTTFHRAWAEHYEQFVAHSERIAADKELSVQRLLVADDNRLASDQTFIETFLLMSLSVEDTDNPVKADLICQCALQLKDIPIFWKAFSQWAHTHQGQPIPRHYQEAAFMFGNLEHNVDISRIPFSPEVKESYAELMQAAARLAGMTTEQLADRLRPRFGHTYYYDYYLMRGLKTN